MAVPAHTRPIWKLKHPLVVMDSNHKSRTRVLLTAALTLTAAGLATLCALAGAQPGLLRDFQVIRVSAVKAALEEIIADIPGLSKVLGAALEELIQRARIPEAILIYAVSYCSEHRLLDGAEMQECLSRGGLQSDTTAGLQGALGALYAMSVSSALTGAAMHLPCCTRRQRKGRFWNSVSVWIFIAFVTVFLASLIVTVVVCAVHMILAENLPPAVLHFEIGSRFLIITWAACAGQGLAFLLWKW